MKRETITRKNKRTGKYYEKEVEVKNPKTYASKLRNYEDVLDVELYANHSEPKEPSPKPKTSKELSNTSNSYPSDWDKRKNVPCGMSSSDYFNSPCSDIVKRLRGRGIFSMNYKGLGDELDFSGFPKVKEIFLSTNKITSIDFLNTIPKPEELEVLEIWDNSIRPTNIEVFSRFINLKVLKIGTTEHSLKQGRHNYFYGSLKSYQNLTKLKEICIETCHIGEGLEYLPVSLIEANKKRSYGSMSIIQCSPNGLEVGCGRIQDALRPFNYDLEAWQLAHPHLMYKVHPEYFTNPESKDKWLKALEDKLVKTQEKLNETKEKEPQAVKRIERLESKVKRLEEIQIKLGAKKKINDERIKRERLVCQKGELEKKLKSWHQKQLKLIRDIDDCIKKYEKVEEVKVEVEKPKLEAVIEYVMPCSWPNKN